MDMESLDALRDYLNAKGIEHEDAMPLKHLQMLVARRVDFGRLQSADVERTDSTHRLCATSHRDTASCSMAFFLCVSDVFLRART